MTKNDKIIRLACYATNVTMAVVVNFSPLLFLSFRSLYGISYTLLGLLVLINFCTQLSVDLVFSFFSHKFNISKAVKLSPILAIIGLVIFSVYPMLFSESAYVGLVIGTVIFSAGSGFAEVLISPVIAALPAKDPDREMSKLHSIYAWGAVGVVVVTTLYLLVFGAENWYYLGLFYTILPILALALFANGTIPKMETPEKTSGAIKFLKNPLVWVSFIGIFMGGAAEVTMAQWASGYLEQAGMDKVWGDIFGVAMFAIMLGLGRSAYAKFGKNLSTVLFAGAIGATLCYFVAAVTPIPIIGLIACAFTGFCVSMMWPGSLVVASDRFPKGGVLIFALMAAGGDFGASVGPQLVGVVTDAAIANPSLIRMASEFGITPEQFGMKLGMFIGMLFPLIAIFVFASFMISDKKKKKAEAVK